MGYSPDNVGSMPELDALVSKGGVVVVDLWAEWCGPCKQYGPIFNKVGADFEGKADFVKVDVDSATDVSQAYGVVSIPTTLVFKGGELVDRIGGPVRPKVLAGKVDALI